jgi:hypothetical protein
MMAGEGRAALVNGSGIVTHFCGKGGDQAVIRRNIFQDATEEPGLASGGANLGGPEPSNGEKTAQPFSVTGDEGKGLNCKRFRFLSPKFMTLFHKETCLSVSS